MSSYIGASHFLIISDAAFFNLSLLTGDLWSVIFSVIAEHIVPEPLFFAALMLVLSGVVMYEMAPSPALGKGMISNNNDGIMMISWYDHSSTNVARGQEI